jgi:DNA replication protein DnaC
MKKGYELLIVGELGFVPLSKTGAELLFEMLSQRYERGSTMLTSNLPFQEWPRLGTADRRTARPPYPSRPHPGDERRQLPP